jgi:hypothetical protein
MNSKIYQNIFSAAELTILQDHFDQKPFTHIQIENDVVWCKNKNLDYHIPNTPVYEIVKAKITEIIGEHNIASGSYKESYVPYRLHIDGSGRPDFKLNSISNLEPNKDVAVLIPLNENKNFRTITFRCYDSTFPKNSPLKNEWLNSANNLDLDYFTHINENDRKHIPLLPLDQIYEWKLGSCFLWPRSQLHTSTDFAKYGLIKKFMILFIV